MLTVHPTACLESNTCIKNLCAEWCPLWSFLWVVTRPKLQYEKRERWGYPFLDIHMFVLKIAKYKYVCRNRGERMGCMYIRRRCRGEGRGHGNHHTAAAIPFIYSFSGNSAASAPISTFMCLWAIYRVPGSVYIFPPAEQADPSLEYIIRSQTHERGN